MQQDWDVIRKILLKVESLPKLGSFNSNELVNGEIDSDLVTYNLISLFDYRLIDGILKKGTSGSLWCDVANLTPEGSKFLDLIRHDATWANIKEKAIEEGIEQYSSHIEHEDNSRSAS